MITENDFDFYFLCINPVTKDYQDHHIPLAIGPGWYQLVYDLCDRINNYLINSTDASLIKSFYVLQVKEKFGTLRFYVSTYDNENYLYNLIRTYETKSAHVCENCGKPGCLRYQLSYKQTLCRNCYKQMVIKENELGLWLDWIFIDPFRKLEDYDELRD
jgi:hypothetical protein